MLRLGRPEEADYEASWKLTADFADHKGSESADGHTGFDSVAGQIHYFEDNQHRSWVTLPRAWIR